MSYLTLTDDNCTVRYDMLVNKNAETRLSKGRILYFYEKYVNAIYKQRLKVHFVSTNLPIMYRSLFTKRLPPPPSPSLLWSYFSVLWVPLRWSLCLPPSHTPFLFIYIKGDEVLIRRWIMTKYMYYAPSADHDLTAFDLNLIVIRLDLKFVGGSHI